MDKRQLQSLRDRMKMWAIREVANASGYRVSEREMSGSLFRAFPEGAAMFPFLSDFLSAFRSCFKVCCVAMGKQRWGNIVVVCFCACMFFFCCCCCCCCCCYFGGG